jgi:hypothetical protein
MPYSQNVAIEMIPNERMTVVFGKLLEPSELVVRVDCSCVG